MTGRKWIYGVQEFVKEIFRNHNRIGLMFMKDICSLVYEIFNCHEDLIEYTVEEVFWRHFPDFDKELFTEKFFKLVPIYLEKLGFKASITKKMHIIISEEESEDDFHAIEDFDNEEEDYESGVAHITDHIPRKSGPEDSNKKIRTDILNFHDYIETIMEKFVQDASRFSEFQANLNNSQNRIDFLDLSVSNYVKNHCYIMKLLFSATIEKMQQDFPGDSFIPLEIPALMVLEHFKVVQIGWFEDKSKRLGKFAVVCGPFYRKNNNCHDDSNEFYDYYANNYTTDRKCTSENKKHVEKHRWYPILVAQNRLKNIVLFSKPLFPGNSQKGLIAFWGDAKVTLTTKIPSMCPKIQENGILDPNDPTNDIELDADDCHSDYIFNNPFVFDEIMKMIDFLQFSSTQEKEGFQERVRVLWTNDFHYHFRSIPKFGSNLSNSEKEIIFRFVKKDQFFFQPPVAQFQEALRSRAWDRYQQKLSGLASKGDEDEIFDYSSESDPSEEDSEGVLTNKWRKTEVDDSEERKEKELVRRYKKETRLLNTEKKYSYIIENNVTMHFFLQIISIIFGRELEQIQNFFIEVALEDFVPPKFGKKENKPKEQELSVEILEPDQDANDQFNSLITSGSGDEIRVKRRRKRKHPPQSSEYEEKDDKENVVKARKRRRKIIAPKEEEDDNLILDEGYDELQKMILTFPDLVLKKYGNLPFVQKNEKVSQALDELCEKLYSKQKEGKLLDNHNELDFSKNFHSKFMKLVKFLRKDMWTHTDLTNLLVEFVSLFHMIDISSPSIKTLSPIHLDSPKKRRSHNEDSEEFEENTSSSHSNPAKNPKKIEEWFMSGYQTPNLENKKKSIQNHAFDPLLDLRRNYMFPVVYDTEQDVKYYYKIDDLSFQKESRPLMAINETDYDPLSYFNYRNLNDHNQEMKKRGMTSFTAGCECSGSCHFLNPFTKSHVHLCSCGTENEIFPYTTDNRLSDLFPRDEYITECNSSCSCAAHSLSLSSKTRCPNRLVQYGSKIAFVVVKTQNGRGWGIKVQPSEFFYDEEDKMNKKKKRNPLSDNGFIKRGTFLCCYLGELISDSEAEIRGIIGEKLGDPVSYVFDLAKKNAPSSVNLEDETTDDNVFSCDAKPKGNLGRFLNHSCDPNVEAVSVLIEVSDHRCPLLALFSKRDIQPDEELCLDYKYQKNNIVKCLCGSPKCCGWLR